MTATTPRPIPQPDEADGYLAAHHRKLFARLDFSIADLWARARAGQFWRHVTANGMDRDLYRLTMSQLFHYTRHNSINQAVAAFRAAPEELLLLRFVYDHAREELGHERMILHDLRSCGLLGDEERLDDPLPATDALVSYLYGVALREGPLPRLGYSYWAESVYVHIGPLLLATRDSLGLADRQMTFFAAHAAIDARHAEQVRAAIRRSVTTAESAAAVHRVAVTSLWLTTQILEQAFADVAANAPAWEAP
jgi:pyrroloquinoline quinone (PQQ) biosynthesis protein C